MPTKTQRASKAQLQAVADAAHEVWADIVMPARWFEEPAFKSKQEHILALKAALNAAGYPVEITRVSGIRTTSPTQRTTESVEPASVLGG